jgi:very-short-patch-repair endonuclease
MDKRVAPVISARMRPTASEFFGASFETGPLQNYKFRRQHLIDPYILDFYCPALKLAIELDGSGHSYRNREKRDRVREEFLTKRGIPIVRFWNHQVREELESVVEAIWLALEERNAANPSPSSSPFSKGRGEIRPSSSQR